MFLFIIAYLFIVRRLCSAFFVVYTCIRGGCFTLFLKWKEQITTILQFAFNLGCFVVVVVLNTQWGKCAYFFVIKENVFFPWIRPYNVFGELHILVVGPPLCILFFGVSQKTKSLFFLCCSFLRRKCMCHWVAIFSRLESILHKHFIHFLNWNKLNYKQEETYIILVIVFVFYKECNKNMLVFRTWRDKIIHTA